MSPYLWLLPLAYVSGSIPFGVIVTQLFAKKDVRAGGSGNIGATNVARVAGKKLGVLVLLLDAAKGTWVVLLAQAVAPAEAWLHVAVGAMAFVGHVFPVWLRFKGGKGVATALGVLAVLLPYAALAGFVVYGLLLALFRVSSVGSLAGGLTAVAVGFFLPVPAPYPWLALGLLLAMIFTHRGNLERLWKRSENKV